MCTRYKVIDEKWQILYTAWHQLELCIVRDLMCVGIIQSILKRPKLEIFLAEFFFTQSKPVGLDELGTRKGI